MNKRQRIKPELVEMAKALREHGHSWRTIEDQTGVSAYRIKCELEPQYRETRALQVNANRHKYVGPKVKTEPKLNCYGAPKMQNVVSSMTMRIPDRVLEDRDRRAMTEHTSLTASFCGDPLPGRSALDKRKPGIE